MVWESQLSNRENFENNQNYTKHYVFEPNSFVPLFQTGYIGFIKLIETPDYSLMCAEITGDFHLGDFRQPTCKSPLPFDLVS